MAESIVFGDLTPEFGEVTIPRNGELVTLKTYKAGKRCPGTIKGMVSSIRREYAIATRAGETEPVIDDDTGLPKVDADGEPILRDLWEPDDEAWYRQLRNVLTAITPGLSEEEANVMSSDDVKCVELFRQLGWWAARPEEDDAEGEATAGETVTESPTSSPA